MSVFPAYSTMPTGVISPRLLVQAAVLLALAGLILAQSLRPPVIVTERPKEFRVAEAAPTRPRVVVSQLEVEPAIFGKDEIAVRFGNATFVATRTAINAQQGVYEVRLDEGRVMKLYVKPVSRSKRSPARRA